MQLPWIELLRCYISKYCNTEGLHAPVIKQASPNPISSRKHYIYYTAHKLLCCTNFFKESIDYSLSSVFEVEEKILTMVPRSCPEWCLLLLMRHMLSQVTVSHSCSHKCKVTSISSKSIRGRYSQVNPEHTLNRDIAAVATLTVAKPHFMNGRAFQLPKRVYEQNLLKGGAAICIST